MYDLSILIPARNEMFLAKTVEDILEHREGKTEVIVGMDGAWADPGIPDHPDVTIVYVSESIGQRAMTNRLCRLSKAKYVAKSDAHVSFKQGFDVELMKAMEGHDNWTVVPTMKNLHAFDWKCMKCGKRTYQGPTPKSCDDCDNTHNFERKILWKAKDSPNSSSYCFDNTLHFQYFKEFNKRPEGQGDITPSMSLQGSFFMMTREKYWELNICDEAHGSWGQQGVEVACKTWLSGGEVMVVRTTWYAHMFRTQGGDFGFPYPISGKQVDNARKYSRDMWLNNKFEKQIYPLKWLMDKFAPVPGWSKEDLAKLSSEPTKGIIYYTDNQLNLRLAKAVQKRLKATGLPITSASLKPMDNMGTNIHLTLERGTLSMFKQILAALEASKEDIVYLCEHDVLYHPTHFDFTPARKDMFYYNHNVWRVHPDGRAVHWDANQVAELCGYREHLLDFYRKRVQEVEDGTFDRRYEPGGRDTSQYETWWSEYPNIDVRHGANLTKSKWSPKDFRDKSTCVNWQETTIDNIDEWGDLSDIIKP